MGKVISVNMHVSTLESLDKLMNLLKKQGVQCNRNRFINDAVKDRLVKVLKEIRRL